MEGEATGFFMSTDSVLQLSYKILAFSCRSSIASCMSQPNSMELLVVSDLLLLDCPP